MRWGMVVADLGTDLRENAPIIMIGLLALTGFIAFRIITKMVFRLIVLAVIAVLGIFVTVERQDIRECGRACNCNVGGVDIDVPFCDRELT